jgi:DNA-binding transcriptional regulator YiaG
MTTTRQRPLSPKTIQQIRARLKETTAVFGARFGRSGRTVEDWEQGRRTPDVLALRLLRDLWTARTG